MLSIRVYRYCYPHFLSGFVALLFCCLSLPFPPRRKFFHLPPPPLSPPGQQEKKEKLYVLTSSVLYRHTAKMADSLKMGNLSLNDSQHAPPPTQPSGRGAYIPPHLRRNMNMDGATPPPGPGSWAPRYAYSPLSSPLRQYNLVLWILHGWMTDCGLQRTWKLGQRQRFQPPWSQW